MTRTQIFMRRPNLENIPASPDIPAGYELRPFTSDDSEAELCITLESAFPEEGAWSLERLHDELTQSPTVTTTFVVMHNGIPVAVTGSRYLPDMYPGSGYVHWVGTRPDHTRKGLGMALLVRVLNDFAEHGYADAVLDTDDFRIPAIRTYLRCGFVPAPDVPDDSHWNRWSAIFPTLFPESPRR